MLTLNTIRMPVGSNRASKRLGRGTGSGNGTTAGKGDKGQKARRGGSKPRIAFEGGQTPLYRRLPKVGFNNFHRRDIAVINVGDLNELDSKLKEVSLESLTQAGILKGRFDHLKILGEGELKKALQVKALRVSETAKSKIEAAGGSVELLKIPSHRDKPRFSRKRKATTK